MKFSIHSVIYLAVGAALAFASVGCSDDNKDPGFRASTITISEISPLTALPGVEVTITGSNFGNSGRVYFNDSEATEIVSYTNTAIVAIVPENAASGRVGVISGEDYGFSVQEFTLIPSAVITSLSIEKSPIGEPVSIYGKNFHQIPVSDLVVSFNGQAADIINFTPTQIDVVIPEGATTGPLTVKFGDIQTVKWDLFTIGAKPIVVDDIIIPLYDFETSGGNISIKPAPENFIESTKNGAYAVYKVSVPTSAKYTWHAMMSTNQSYACYLNLDMGTDMDKLIERPADTALSRQFVKEGWATFREYEFETFQLEANMTYYLRVYFLADGTSWVGNVNEIRLKLAADQEADAIQVGEGLGYNLFACDFNGPSYAPFTPAWAWDPSYIKTVDGYLEYYFNQAALDADDRRERRGCEITCPFSTTSDGWYGYKLYLPEGQFPKNAKGSIISQIFNKGAANTWAGHLHIDGENLMIGYRASPAATAEVDKLVGKLEWGKWVNVVIYFRAGRNNKGNIKVWLGDNLDESKPTFDSGNINFGFGDWIDDSTMDKKTTSLGGKWGLYVSSGGDRTMRMDDLKVLQGNPAGAFDIVCPK